MNRNFYSIIELIKYFKFREVFYFTLIIGVYKVVANYQTKLPDKIDTNILVS